MPSFITKLSDPIAKKDVLHAVLQSYFIFVEKRTQTLKDTLLSREIIYAVRRP